MAKLYLIRRNLESFIGPMTTAEMKEAYQRMQFGLQDEVSGHCGPWASFDDLPSLKRHYPEIARIVHDEMLPGWGVSDHGVLLPAKHDEPRREPKPSPSRGLGVALTLLAIAAAAFLAAVYLATTSGRLSGKAKEAELSFSPEDLQGLLDRGDEAGFERLVQDSLEALVDRTTRLKRNEPQWLPYLRHYAFSHEGAVLGLPAKLLRGDGAASAPVDCSLKTWRRRWRASLRFWPDFVFQRKLIRAHWSRLLAWDPHWIRRREVKGWVQGGSYYIGCLVMADRALTELFSDPSLVSTAADWEKMGINKIKQRLVWLLEMTRDGVSTQSWAPVTGQGLSVWTCLEGARDPKDLQRCREPAVLGTEQDAWQSYTEERFGWNLLRVATSGRSTPPPELQPLLMQLGLKAPKSDHFTRFDYRAEQRFWRTTVKLPPPPPDKAAGEAPEVKPGP